MPAAIRQDSSPIRVAVTGAGWVTLNRHLPALQRSPLFDVVGVIDSNRERAASVASRFGLRRSAVSTALDADWLDEIEAITIGAPPTVHAPLVRRALEAGKHVLTEKPLAMSPQDGEEMQALAERQQRILSVVHNFQFSRSARKLRARIAAGTFGPVTGIMALQLSNPRRRLPVWYEELPWGLFYDESPHLLYLIHCFGGEPTLESAAMTPSAHGRSTPAVVSAQFDCNGVPASLLMHFEAPLSEWHLCVMSEDRIAAIDVFRDVLVELPHDGAHLPLDIMRSSVVSTLTHWRGVVQSGALMLAGKLLYGNDEVVARFGEAIRTGSPPQGISIADGNRVLRLQHAIMACASSR